MSFKTNLERRATCGRKGDITKHGFEFAAHLKGLQQIHDKAKTDFFCTVALKFSDCLEL